VGIVITISAVAMFFVVVGAMLSVFSEPEPVQRHTLVEPEL
jgi:hypothetical protein